MKFIIKSVLKKLGWRATGVILTAGLSYLLEKINSQENEEN